MKLRVDLTGQKFGRLKVIKESGRNKFSSVLWECICDCGNILYIPTGRLRSGNTSSCGCFRKDDASKRFRKHEFHRTPEYTSWQLMKDRCLNKNNQDFNHYGGRGITVCDEWINSPQQFINDMGLRPSKNHSLDRIDCNGNYEPKNCRWATKAEQSRNRRDSKLLTIEGITKHLADWSDDYGMPYSEVYKRIWRGMNPMQALTQPLRIR